MDRTRCSLRVGHRTVEVEVSNGVARLRQWFPAYLFRLEIEPDSVVLPDRMSIRPTSPASPLEVFAAHQTCVDVDVAQTLRAQPLEIEIEILPGHLKAPSAPNTMASKEGEPSSPNKTRG
jgi:hypothetical protein